jgi:hypothetical protein
VCSGQSFGTTLNSYAGAEADASIYDIILTT